MEIIDPFPFTLFRKGDSKKELSKKGREKRAENEKYLHCRICENRITKLSQKTDVQGGFEHNFLNPGGKIFRIGCFHDAEGSLSIGIPSAEWSWFQGYSWQISTCKRCMSHLGWYYSCDEKPGFYGLILKALI